MLAKIGLILVVVGNLLLFSLVLFRNKKALLNKLFAMLTSVVMIWSIAQYVSNIKSTEYIELFSNRLSFAAGLLLIAMVWVFSLFFPIKQRISKIQLYLAVIVLPTTALMTLFSSGVIVDSTYALEKEVTDVKTGQLYPVYLIVIIGFLIILIINIWKSYKQNKNNYIRSQQIMFVSTGIFLTFLWILITTALVPALTNDWTLSKVGPVGSLFLVGFTAYAVIKHKLFDIRLIVARSLGYILTLGTLVGVYVLTIFGLSSTVLGTGQLTGVQQILYIVATLIFGFSLQPLKKFFDKLTNKLFYRDAYDAQELLDKLNKILVGNIDLDTILKQTSDIIALTMKADFVAFVIRETSGTSRRASFSKIVQIDTDAILGIQTKKKGKTSLYVADEIEDENDKVKTLLSANNISIAARMVASGEGSQDQGYLLLGAKQSGNPYNKQDVQLLEIIANELVIAIQNAVRFEEIETFNITLQQKVNDATRQLRQTNEKLKSLDETKDEFISMASHQLRTPLTAVKGYVSMVVEGDAGKLNKQQKELLDQAFASSQRMVYLIADLLNVSRLRSGKFVIENKPTQLADVVESEMEQLTEVAKGKDQTLTYKKPDNFPEVMLDETKIRQVIMNFADNALHYTQNGGHIQINLTDKGDTIEYTVVDDGLGVPKAEQHHMFTKFYRAGNAKKARPDGTGLGLFMAKKVIIAQGGAIIFQSEEGKGSTFGFTFPKAKLLVPKSTDKK